MRCRTPWAAASLLLAVVVQGCATHDAEGEPGESSDALQRLEPPEDALAAPASCRTAASKVSVGGGGGRSLSSCTASRQADGTVKVVLEMAEGGWVRIVGLSPTKSYPQTSGPVFKEGTKPIVEARAPAADGRFANFGSEAPALVVVDEGPSLRGYGRVRGLADLVHIDDLARPGQGGTRRETRYVTFDVSF